MNKNTKKIAIVSLIGVSVFLVGSIVGATGADWFTKMSVDASKEIQSAGNSKTVELVTDVDTKIQEKVKEKIDPIIEAKKANIQVELQKYFDEKLNGLTDSDEYNAIAAELDRIEGVLLDQYKRQIDNAFDGK
jgi:hypothetical protein